MTALPESVKPIVPALNDMQGRLQQVCTNGAEKKQLADVDKAVVVLLGKLGSGAVDTVVAEKVTQLVTAQAANDKLAAEAEAKRLIADATEKAEVSSGIAVRVQAEKEVVESHYMDDVIYNVFGLCVPVEKLKEGFQKKMLHRNLMLDIDGQMKAMVGAWSDCQKVSHYPFPFPYVQALSIFNLLYCVSLPISLVSTMGPWTPRLAYRMLCNGYGNIRYSF